MSSPDPLKDVIAAFAEAFGWLSAFLIMCGIAFGIFTAWNQSLPPQDRIDLLAPDHTPANP